MPRAASTSSVSPVFPPALWADCVQALSRKIDRKLFDLWIKPLTAQVDEQTASVTVFAPSRFKLDFIRDRYFGSIQTTLETLCGAPVNVRMAVAAQPAGRPRPAPSPKSRPAPQPARAEAAVADKAEADESTAAAAERPRHQLKPDFTFDTLVPGSANRMAYSAAQHVIGCLTGVHADAYLKAKCNPLFIYGGVGLGKTHLMHAMGNRLLQLRPQARVLYIHAEQFVTDVVHASMNKSFESMRDKYHSLDLLLIDDVQFFTGNKEKTQEEFYNTFEALLAKESQVVMTSDTYPKGLTNIPERLVSRFDSGLSVLLEPPEFEMRVAILMNKAAAMDEKLPEDVAFFIARTVHSNVRELEGALTKVLAYSRFNGEPLSIPMAKEALRDLLSIKNRQISVENIQKAVADFYRIKVADMYSKRRPMAIARPRQIAMYLAKELTQKSLPEIGELFGGRDHTTVLHAVKKISADRQQDTELNQQLHVLEQTIKG